MSEIRKVFLSDMNICESTDKFVSIIQRIIKNVDEDDYIELHIVDANISNIEISASMMDKIPQVKAFTFKDCELNNVLFTNLNQCLRRISFIGST